jgi:hypothetical protein
MSLSIQEIEDMYMNGLMEKAMYLAMINMININTNNKEEKHCNHILNYLPCQFVGGKTNRSIENIIKLQDIQTYDKGVFPVSIVFSRNNLEESKSWKYRTKNSKIRRVIQFSSKSDSDIHTYEGISSLFLDCLVEEDLPSCLIMCNHPKRIKDMIRIIHRFENKTYNLHESTNYKTIVVNIFFDEPHACCGNIRTFYDFFIKENKFPSIFNQIVYMDATPDDNKFTKLLKDFDITALSLNIDTMTRKIYEEQKKEYMNLEQHNIIYYDNLTKDPVEYVRSYIPNMKGNKNILFCPAGHKTDTHEDMYNVLKDHGYNVLVHNGKHKEFRMITGNVISLDEYSKNHEINGELRELLRHFIENNPGNFGITGNETISTGVTFNTNGFNFTSGFVSQYHSKDASSLRQILGRFCGNKKYVKKMDVIIPTQIFNKYKDRLYNMEIMMSNSIECIETKELMLTGKKDYHAFTIPMLINITVKDVKRICDYKTSESEERKKYICNIVKKEDVLGDLNYNYSNFIYNTIPGSDNSYKTHILDIIKIKDSNKKGGLLDVNWNKKKYKPYQYKKCWWVFIDKRENRLLLIRWNGLNLKNK